MITLFDNVYLGCIPAPPLTKNPEPPVLIFVVRQTNMKPMALARENGLVAYTHELRLTAGKSDTREHPAEVGTFM
jgi:hypothetical protein